MLYPRANKLFYLLLLFWIPAPLFADNTTEGWTWTIGCPGDGTTAASTFAATSADGSGFTGSGSCSRTTTHFTQFTFTSSSGATLNTSTLYGIHTGDWLVIPPVVNTETFPVYTVSSLCPVAAVTLNWIFVQWDAGTRTMADTYVLGGATYTPGGSINVTGQYDVTGVPYWAGLVPMPGGCSNGTYTATGSADLVEGCISPRMAPAFIRLRSGMRLFSFRSTP